MHRHVHPFVNSVLSLLHQIYIPWYAECQSNTRRVPLKKKKIVHHCIAIPKYWHTWNIGFVLYLFLPALNCFLWVPPGHIWACFKLGHFNQHVKSPLLAGTDPWWITVPGYLANTLKAPLSACFLPYYEEYVSSIFLLHNPWDAPAHNFQLNKHSNYESFSWKKTRSSLR